jgi:hypothetical protein
MTASPLVSGSGQPEREAARLAVANGARLIEVDTAGWPFRIRVMVEVQPGHRLSSPRFPSLRANAAASARPIGHMRYILPGNKGERMHHG